MDISTAGKRLYLRLFGRNAGVSEAALTSTTEQTVPDRPVGRVVTDSQLELLRQIALSSRMLDGEWPDGSPFIIGRN